MNNIAAIKKQVTKINQFEKEIGNLTEVEIRERIKSLIEEYSKEKNFDNILVESFALTREASKRSLGLRHFDSQLMGGIVLHNGKIAEMKTGEGKTLAATLAIVLNALSLKGVHVVTVNDYLAKRDKQGLSKLYRYLGLTVGLIRENMDYIDRKKNYAAHITYVTNSELAFDYLRDNLATSSNNVVLREFNYCIIDEVDSILIDEARTPLIISEKSEGSTQKYIFANEVTNFLKYDTHYKIDEKAKIITLTSKGIKQTENLLKTKTLYDINDPWIPYITNALRANFFFKKNVHYFIQKENIVIVDENTGRVMENRRWGEGLHEAIEAKERVLIKKGSETISSITYQNFFLSYPKIAGMTGTAKTDEVELKKIYKLDVIVLPTNLPMLRKDLNDCIFQNSFSKWKAIAQKTKELHQYGRPILIGTTSIANSMIISELLKELNMKHRILNAKPENLKLESEIIAQAGMRYAITVATNMAGRGTDILLGGNPDFKSRQQVLNFVIQMKKNKIFFFGKKIGLLTLVNADNSIEAKKWIGREIEVKAILKKIIQEYLKNDIPIVKFIEAFNIIKELTKKEIDVIMLNIVENGYINSKNIIDLYIKVIYEYYYIKNKKNMQFEKDLIKNLGGLYVIGTERHESRRIDNQLRGRAGRQGDPGTSEFYISLDDNIFRIFGSNNLKIIIGSLNVDENIDLGSKILNNLLDKAQKKVEDYYYEIRKELFNYDKVLNSQRIALFNKKKIVLESLDLTEIVKDFAKELISEYQNRNNQKVIDKLENRFSLRKIKIFIKTLNLINTKKLKGFTYDKSENSMLLNFQSAYKSKEQSYNSSEPSFMLDFGKFVIINNINSCWKSHLQRADLIKETIGLRGYGQLDPLEEYKKELDILFVATTREMKYSSVRDILKSKFKKRS